MSSLSFHLVRGCLLDLFTNFKMQWPFSVAKSSFKAFYLFTQYAIWRVSDQNGVSLLWIMLEIHHSGREALNIMQRFPKTPVPVLYINFVSVWFNSHTKSERFMIHWFQTYNWTVRYSSTIAYTVKIAIIMFVKEKWCIFLFRRLGGGGGVFLSLSQKCRSKIKPL